jgi:hypothetical protein
VRYLGRTPLLAFFAALGLASSASAQVPRETYACEHPALWLARVPLAQMEASYCEQCAARCGGGQVAWDMLRDDRATRYACRELEYASLAIGAALGERIEDPEWRDYFEAQPWYRARTPRWTEAARANQRLLQAAARSCWARTPRVPRAIRRRVVRWFERLHDGHPEVPRRVFADGEQATRAEILERLRNPDLFRFTARTSITRMGADAPGGPGTFMIATGRPGVDCVGGGEECEGYEWVELTFDRAGRLTALHVAAAACPHLYVVTEGQTQLVSEILRNQNRASLAGADAVALGPNQSGAVCASGALEIELREEKLETTYLREVVLEVDGQRFAPTEPVGPRVLRFGDRLRVRFEGLPAVFGDVRVVAVGYYVPD